MFGHASSLVEIDGVNLLIDPVWDEHATPTQWAGPKRFLCPGHKDVHGANPAGHRSCTTEGSMDDCLGPILPIDAPLTVAIFRGIIHYELFELNYAD
jgi:L-ascorbate metabolism protein UlaG (beta-lactamase superfamily)